MSSSEDENLSDLEGDQAAVNSDGEEEDKVELKGILNDVEETEVSWKDLVNICELLIVSTWIYCWLFQGLIDVLCEACEDLKWKTPSKIQREAIPVALKGHDIIGLAETGSG